MTRRRANPPWAQRVVTVIETRTPGSLGGRTWQGSPASGDDSMDAAASTGGVAGSVIVSDAAAVDLFAYDTFTLAADGAQDLTLSHSAVAESVHVTIGACPQINGVDYSVADDTLSLITTSGLTGMKVDVKYAYVTTTPDTAETG